METDHCSFMTMPSGVAHSPKTIQLKDPKHSDVCHVPKTEASFQKDSVVVSWIYWQLWFTVPCPYTVVPLVYTSEETK
jgi:hypothetical protein